jgi:hypothetical protein
VSTQPQRRSANDQRLTSAGPDDARDESPLHRWRFRRFRALGFDDADATLLADRDVDWHEAEKLVCERGCPTAIAAKILS